MQNEININFDALLLESDEDFDESTEIAENVVLAHSGDESEEEEEDQQEDERIFDNDDWSARIYPLPPFTFQSRASFNDLRLDLQTAEPIDFYRLFLNNNLVADIIRETNRYGSTNSSSFINMEEGEFLKFIGLCLHMGIVKLPTLRNYWSSRMIYGGNSVCRSTMTRDRFESILCNLHFCNNNDHDSRDRLFKISSILNSFNLTSSSVFTPGRDVAIDESMVPFRGRIYFKQYIPNKKHKFGIKLFKLCAKGGYTSKIEVYCGKVNDKSGSVAETVVMKLMDGFLDCGRRLYCDNWYSSLPLTKKLLERQTDFVGTFRKNRKGFPKIVTQKKLRKGEMEANQHKNGITVVQWQDKRPVFCMSTCHGTEVDDNNVPLLVRDYNKSMLFVDTSDQISAYYPFVRRTSKWYMRCFFHIMLQTSLVNAWVLYCSYVSKMPFLEFKAEVAEKLLELDAPSKNNQRAKKVLEEIKGPLVKTRKSCTGCYKKLATTSGRAIAKKQVKRVNTRCSQCKKYICLDCFNSSHIKCFCLDQ